MKKFLLYFTIAMCFGFISQKAMAAVGSVADLCGKYAFTATQVSVAEGYEFPTSYEVTISENEYSTNGVIIEGFAGSTVPMTATVDLNAKTMTVESMPAYGEDNSIVFSNGEGKYPYTQGEYVTLTFTFDDDKNLSLGAYSIVSVVHNPASATILGSYKDAVGVAQAGSEEPSEEINFAGTYKVTAAYVYDYVNGASSSMTYDIEVKAGTEAGSYEVTSIAGYDNAMVTATAEGNVLTINLGYNFLTTGAIYDVLGDASYANDYSMEGGLTITYADGAYTMSDYSVWTATWTSEGTTYARKLYVSGNEITEGPEQGGTSEPVETIDYTGTWKISIDKSACYSFDTTYEYPVESNFTMEKQDDGSYMINSFLNSPDPYGGIVATPSDDNLVIGNLGYALLSAGQKSYHLMDANATIEGTITLTNAGGNSFTVHDFYIGSTDYTDWQNPVTEKAVYIWGQAVTITKVTSAIENVAVDANAPVEYYNLQGVKVANPENGIFIKKQGAKAIKVVL